MSCLFGHFFPQFEVFKTTIFEETLPDFIKEENTHPSKGGERTKGGERKGTMSNQEERTTNVQTRDGKNDFALKAMSKHLLPMHLCGFYIGDPSIPIMHPIQRH